MREAIDRTNQSGRLRVAFIAEVISLAAAFATGGRA